MNENTNTNTNTTDVTVESTTFSDEFRNAVDCMREENTTALTVTIKGVEHSIDAKDVPFIHRIRASLKASEFSTIQTAGLLAHLKNTGAYNRYTVKDAGSLCSKLGIPITSGNANKYTKVGERFLYLDDNGDVQYRDGIPHLPVHSLDVLASMAIEQKADDGTTTWDIRPVIDYCEANGITSFWSQSKIKKLTQKNKPDIVDESGNDSPETDNTDSKTATSPNNAPASALPIDSRARRLEVANEGYNSLITYLNDFGGKAENKASATLSAFFNHELEDMGKGLNENDPAWIASPETEG